MLWPLGFWMAGWGGSTLVSWFLGAAGTQDEPSPWMPVIVLGMVLLFLLVALWIVVAIPIIVPVAFQTARPVLEVAIQPFLAVIKLVESALEPLLKLLGVVL